VAGTPSLDDAFVLLAFRLGPPCFAVLIPVSSLNPINLVGRTYTELLDLGRWTQVTARHSSADLELQSAR